MSECIWKEENGVDSDGTYITSCDNMFTIIEGNPKDNNFKYCPYCGKALKEKDKNVEWDVVGIGDSHGQKK